MNRYGELLKMIIISLSRKKILLGVRIALGSTKIAKIKQRSSSPFQDIITKKTGKNITNSQNKIQKSEQKTSLQEGTETKKERGMPESNISSPTLMSQDQQGETPVVCREQTLNDNDPIHGIRYTTELVD